MDRYEQALILFDINYGFVDEHLEEIYNRLKSENNPDVYEFLSPEYMEASKKRDKIVTAYYTLYSIFKNYILSRPDEDEYSKEKMEEEIFKLIHNSVKEKKEVDEPFIASLTEVMVSNLGLHDYVRRIQFQYHDRNAYASYDSQNNKLTIYFSSIIDSIKRSNNLRFSLLEQKCYPYCQIISIIRHEIEHANQEKMKLQKRNDIYTRLSVAKEAIHVKRDQELERIVGYPFFIYVFAALVRKIKLFNDYRKYYGNWSSISTERIADISSYNLILNLLDRMSISNFPLLEELFKDQLESIIISGYDKSPYPAISYLEKFKQYDDCLEIMEMSKGLSLEERLALGLEVTPLEQDYFSKNKEKVIQNIRKMY